MVFVNAVLTWYFFDQDRLVMASAVGVCALIFAWSATTRSGRICLAGPAYDGEKWRQANFVLRLLRCSTTVPKGLLIDLLMPPDRAEDALFNILGRYDYWIAQHGPRKARIIFWTQSAGAVFSFWTEWLLRRVQLLKIWRRS